MAEDADRRPPRFAIVAALDEGEVLSFPFETFESVTNGAPRTHRPRFFDTDINAGKR